MKKERTPLNSRIYLTKTRFKCKFTDLDKRQINFWIHAFYGLWMYLLEQIFIPKVNINQGSIK
jgi:hypothetical protein